MFEKFTAMDADRFRQRYQGTFGYFVKGEEKMLSQITEIRVNDGRPYVEFVDNKGLPYKLYSDSPNEGVGFRFLPPKFQYYNTKEGRPLLIDRIAAKQYSRGICSKNTSVTRMTGDRLPVDFGTLEKLFGETVSVKESLKAALALEDVPSAGIALSPQFAVKIPSGDLKCFNVVIGTSKYKDGVFHYTLTGGLWATEVANAFRRSGLEAVPS